jgi:glycosyltransferase involved in cell wall biosynthesis
VSEPQDPGRPDLSLVIPCYDEAENVEPLYREVREVAAGLDRRTEVIFVDDGSADATADVLRQVHAEAKHDPDGPAVKVVLLRRNFGKSSALAAGFQEADGDVVVTLDGDLQDDPHEIPRFLAQLEEGFGLVSGWKRQRHDPLTKTIPSRIFNAVVSALTGIRLHDINCGFKAYRRELVSELRLYGGLHRFIPVLAHAKGFRVGEIEVEHRPRQHGRSKYGAARMPAGFLDLLTVLLLTGYASRPLHFFGGTGLLAFLGGLGISLYLFVVWLNPASGPIGTRPLLTLAVLLMILGIQLVSLGLVGEMILSRHGSPADLYSVAEVLD